MSKFGVLEEVDIRQLWKHEQYDFSNWLAKEANIQMLGDELGLTLTDINKEVFVGSYRCDLVAKDETSGTKVIVENQLETTNHDHLGKIITYASGLDADVIVWIVQKAKEEHKSAIEWLNNKTTSDISFFLIEIHAYKIGDSLPAPKFEIVEKPNDFSKVIKDSSKNGDLTCAEGERLNFWQHLNDELIKRNKPFPLRKATTNHWYNIAIGKTGVHIAISLVNQSNLIGIGLYIKDDKELFDELHNLLEEINEQVPFSLDWQRLDNKKASRIIHYIEGLDFENHSNYNQLIDEIIEKVLRMKSVFSKYIKDAR